MTHQKADVLDQWEKDAQKVTINNDYGRQARRVLKLIATLRKYREARKLAREGEAFMELETLVEAEALLS